MCGTTVNVWPVARIDELKLPVALPGSGDRSAWRTGWTSCWPASDPVFSARWMQKV